MNILAIANSTGARIWRLVPQFEYFRELGHNCAIINAVGLTKQKLDEITENADIVVFQMVAHTDLLKQLKKEGKRIIFEADDLIENVPKSHPMASSANTLRWRLLFYEMIFRADILTVSNETLKNRYSWLKRWKNTEVLPNYMDLEFWKKSYRPNESDNIRIGWAGGLSHKDDLDYISPTLTKVVKKFPKTKFVNIGSGGYSGGGNKLIEFDYYEDQFKDIPLRQREHDVGTRVETWPDKLASMKLDIGIAPLAESKFSKYKTPIKYYEYGINRIPGVFQKFLYKQAVIHGETGYLAESLEEWEYYLTKLIQDRDLREKMGEEAYEHVRTNYNLKPNLSRWAKAYRLPAITPRQEVIRNDRRATEVQKSRPTEAQN